jgi:phospholipid/cholesterol/gamma-HCH transport system permease protein
MGQEAAKSKPAVRKQPDAERAQAPSGQIGPLEALLNFIGETVMLAGRAVITVLRGGLDFSDLMTQMSMIGVDSIWIVLVVTTATGAVFAYYTASLSNSIGFTGFVGGSLGYAFLNELGPVLGGVGFAARAGAAIAAEIGTMVVTEQVDALTSMAVSPIRYLVAPRVLAAVIMLPVLIVFADIAGMVGGYVFAGASGVPHASFINSVYTYVKAEDLINGLIKAVCFGFIVGIVACQQGLKTHGGATGVGRSTTSSVVLCVLLIFVSDVLLTQVLTGPSLRR